MLYRGIDHQLRTNEEYIIHLDGEHHLEGESSIARLPMDLITRNCKILSN